MLTSCGASDAMARVAAFLPWDDLAAVTRCCRATRDAEESPFNRAWVARSALVLPPDSRVSHEILSTVKDINAVVLPHSQWLGMVVEDPTLRPRLARVHRVVVHKTRFQIDSRQALNLQVIPQAFPSTTDLSILQLSAAADIEGLRGFSGLQRLELSSIEDNKACPFSAAGISTIEELKLEGIDIRAIESKEALINLQSIQVRGCDTIDDLAFLWHCANLSVLNLVHATVTRSAIPHLLEIAPRLSRFECTTIESIWSNAGTTPVASADVERLALAFKRLETLIIHYGQVQDLCSFSLISTLRHLQVSEVTTVDLSPLLKLERLEKLHLMSAAPVDIAPLATLPHLKTLTHRWFGKDNVDRSDRTSFSRLQVYEGPHTSLLRMRDFGNLLSLTVSTNNDTAPLNLAHVRAPRLHTLSLRMSEGGDLSDLYLRFPRLRDLTITTIRWDGLASQSQDGLLSHIARLQHLEALNIPSYPHEFDFQQLTRLPNFRKLQLSHCNTTSLSGIEKLTSLREFHLSTQNGSVVLDLSPLESLPRLQVLHLWGCVIADVRPLTRIQSLRVVELPVGTDYEPLVASYHASRMRLPGATSLELQQVKRDWTNCLWSAQ